MHRSMGFDGITGNYFHFRARHNALPQSDMVLRTSSFKM